MHFTEGFWKNHSPIQAQRMARIKKVISENKEFRDGVIRYVRTLDHSKWIKGMEDIVELLSTISFDKLYKLFQEEPTDFNGIKRYAAVNLCAICEIPVFTPTPTCCSKWKYMDDKPYCSRHYQSMNYYKKNNGGSLVGWKPEFGQGRAYFNRGSAKGKEAGEKKRKVAGEKKRKVATGKKGKEEVEEEEDESEEEEEQEYESYDDDDFESDPPIECTKKAAPSPVFFVHDSDDESDRSEPASKKAKVTGNMNPFDYHDQFYEEANSDNMEEFEVIQDTFESPMESISMEVQQTPIGVEITPSIGMNEYEPTPPSISMILIRSNICRSCDSLTAEVLYLINSS